jgi:hypothetical protein
MATEKQRRILDEARSTLRSSSKGLHTVDTLDRDALASWSALKKSRQEQEPPVAPIAPEPPFDWAAYIDQRIAAAIERERDWMIHELLPEIVAAVQNEASVELSFDVRRLNCEIAELRASLGELRAILAADRAARGIAGPGLDVPKPATPVN